MAAEFDPDLRYARGGEAAVNPNDSAPPRWLYVWDPPSVLIRTGECLVPSDLSWRRAYEIVKAGFATIDPYHQPSLGRLMLTPAGHIALATVGDAS